MISYKGVEQSVERCGRAGSVEVRKAAHREPSPHPPPKMWGCGKCGKCGKCDLGTKVWRSVVFLETMEV